MDKQKCTGHKGKLLFWFASFCSTIQILFAPPTLLLVLSLEVQFLRFIFLFFNFSIFNDKKSLDVIILPIIQFLKFFCCLISALCSYLPPSPHFLLEKCRLIVVPHREIALPILKKYPEKVRQSESDLVESTIWSHNGQKDRFIIFGSGAPKMGKKSWRETFGTISVTVQNFLQVKIVKIWPMVAPHKDQTQVLVTRQSKVPFGRTMVKKTDS